MLSARSREGDRVAGLALGANDYVSKRVRVCGMKVEVRRLSGLPIVLKARVEVAAA
jgi:DNA-binding response OmpR family regulator